MSIASDRRLRRYMDNHGITVEIKSGPDWSCEDHFGDGMPWEHYSYVLKLTNADLGTEMTMDWHVGILNGWDIDEHPEHPFDVLISDCSGVDNVSFEEWADDLGYDPDSRRAEATYNAIRAQLNDFVELVGGYGELRRLRDNYERL